MTKKKLVINQILILSTLERAAKSVAFHPSVNLIIGENDVGKSSIIKSIYHTLGADVKFEEKWKKANVITLLTFTFAEVEYKMLRANSNFGIFDSDNKLIQAFGSIVKELAPYLANLFGNKLLVRDSYSKKRVQATPAIQFLASYVDQDKGWSGAWQSFEGLGMFSGYKKDLIEFYVGIKPNEWYVISENIDEISARLVDLRKEYSSLIAAKETVSKNTPKVTFNIDLKVFRKEINLLLTRLTGLKSKEEEYRRKLIIQKNKEAFIDNEISVVNSSIKEITKDYNYSLKQLDEEITCPTCSAIYQNSMVSRFGLLDDVAACRTYLSEYIEEKKTIAKVVSRLEMELSSQRKNILSINEILDKKKGKVRLGDLLKNESAKQVNKVFQDSEEDYKNKINKLESEAKTLKESRKRYDNKERKVEIITRFKSLLDLFYIKLNVQTIGTAAFKNIPSTVQSQGSDTPRALLAYYFAALYTSQEFTNLPLFPLIIDSPNQQDQDEDNRNRIIRFIFDNTPKEYQLFLGTVDLHGATYKGHSVKPLEKLAVLNKSEYEQINKSIAPLLDELHNALLPEN